LDSTPASKLFAARHERAIQNRTPAASKTLAYFTALVARQLPPELIVPAIEFPATAP
jgi:hypothetical protein